MEKILVIKLSALGDFILALGAMEAIRRHHPRAHITLLTTRPFADMATRSRYFDAVEIDPRPGLLDVAGWVRLYRFFNAGSFSRVYDLQLNDRTSFYYRLLSKKPEWSGVVKTASHAYLNPAWRSMHAYERHRAMLDDAGIKVTRPDLSWMNVDVSFFGLKKPFALLIPGSAPQHPEKRWPAAKFGALALRLSREGCTVALIGTAAEEEAIARIRKMAPEAVDLSGKTSFYDIATLARDAAAVVGNDTGPTHIAALAGAPVVALFSRASDPALSSPVGARVAVIQSDDLSDVTPEDVMRQLHLKGAA